MLNTKLYLNESVLTNDTELKSTRDGFAEEIVNQGEKNRNVILMAADLAESLKLGKFEEKFKNRYIEVGIAEQNMTGIATGLALSGKIPFITSYSSFSPSRNFDQVKQSVAQQIANVKIVSSHSGISASADGRSTQALEDIAIMRVLPNMTIIQPTDYYETKKVIEESVTHKGPMYIRMHRENLPSVTTTKTPFEIGKAYVLKEGTDITLITSGPITIEVLKAASYLKTKHKIDAEVITVPTIKPLDAHTILSSVEKTQLAVTIEEHQIIGGLGGATAEILSAQKPTKLLRLGIKDTFGESGTYTELLDKYGLSAHNLEKEVLKFIKDNE
jgi:transketolase